MRIEKEIGEYQKNDIQFRKNRDKKTIEDLIKENHKNKKPTKESNIGSTREELRKIYEEALKEAIAKRDQTSIENFQKALSGLEN